MVKKDIVLFGTGNYFENYMMCHGVVICCARYEEVARLLEDMGVTDYQYYRPVPVEKNFCLGRINRIKVKSPMRSVMSRVCLTCFM